MLTGPQFLHTLVSTTRPVYTDFKTALALALILSFLLVKMWGVSIGWTNSYSEYVLTESQFSNGKPENPVT